MWKTGRSLKLGEMAGDKMAGAFLVAKNNGVSMSSLAFDDILEKIRVSFNDEEAGIVCRSIVLSWRADSHSFRLSGKVRMDSMPLSGQHPLHTNAN